MTIVRAIRWIVLLSALIACVLWSYIAITNLLKFSTTQQQRLSQYGPTAQVQSGEIKRIESTQKQWGRQSLFAVACSFAFLLAVMMNWVLDGREPRPGELR